MKKRIRSILSALFVALMVINTLPVYAAATEATATEAPVAETTDAATTDAATTDAATTDAATTDVAATEETAAVTYEGAYNAFMGIQTNTQLWIFRNAYDDPTYGFGTEEFKGLSAVASGVSTSYEGTFIDAVVDGDGTYTVTLENPDFQSEERLSLLYVSTDIPLSDSIKVTNVICKFDGSTKYTFDEGYLDPESKEFVKILCLNDWNKDVKDLFFYPFPPKKVEITFTIEGFGYQGTVPATPTVAPVADEPKTEAAATDTKTETATATTGTDVDNSDEGGSNTGLIIGIVAAVVVVAGAFIAFVLKKKK
jgi:hypothetical protein